MLSQNPILRHVKENRKAFGPLSPYGQAAAFTVQGPLAAALAFVTREQLLKPTLWHKFVEQFRQQPDSKKGRWRGEFWGKAMRGACFVYSVTGDEALYRVLEDTARELLTVAEPDGRISSYQRDNEFIQWDMWCRKYVLLGLIFFHRICRDEALKAQIVATMQGCADYILDRVGGQAGKMPIGDTSVTKLGTHVHGAMNSLSILEPMVLLYRLTGAKRYLEFAEYIVTDGVVNACGKDIFALALEDKTPPYRYPSTKAYEMISCFEGLLEYAGEVGDKTLQQAAVRFAYRLVATDMTVMGSGGTSHEFFNHAAVRQTVHKGIGQETCVTITLMKLCARMLLHTGDPLFADCFEISLYNAYLGTLNTKGKTNGESISATFLEHLPMVPTVLPFDSYTPVLYGRRGTGVGGSLMFPDGSYYGCCASIGAMGVGMAPHLGFLRTGRGIAAVLYTPGIYTVTTPGGQPVTFTVSGNYPYDGTVKITVSPASPETFTLSLRVPAFSEKTALTVNGETVTVTSGVTDITRAWQPGDTVVLTLDMSVEALCPTPYEKDVLRFKIDWATCQMIEEEEAAEPEDLHYVAFRRGPLVLAAKGVQKPLDGVKNDCILPEKVSGEGEAFSVAVDMAGDEVMLYPVMHVGKDWSEADSFAVWLKTT